MVDEITNLITTLGFPIVCVIACAYFINYIIKAEREENQKREEKYIDTINKFSVNSIFLSNNKTKIVSNVGIININPPIVGTPCLLLCCSLKYSLTF